MATIRAEAAFTLAVEQHRAELQVHCYRMLGSLEDSEDLVQETFLRAWRGRAGFRREGRWSMRAWLYRIATNACLDALAQRQRRVLPADVAPASDPAGPIPAPTDHAWLSPYPDRLLSPEDAAIDRETIALAFLAAIQHLPPRQRAVLILRDVEGWAAKDVADLLDTTVAAVNSALQRARATMRARLPRRREEWTGAPSDEEREVLRRYIDAQQRDDPAALAAVLRDDARFSFPPLPLWYDGAEAFREAARRHAAPGEYRFVATGANRQPAVAAYLRRPDDTEFRPLVIEVLRIEGGRVAEIVDFSSPELFTAFGLPLTLDR